MKRLLRKRWFRVLLILIIVAGAVAYWLWPRRYDITVSRETTYLLGPLHPDGTVNYVAAINKMYSKGVTPENNAAVLMIKAAGPKHIPTKFIDNICKRLGINALPPNGDYFLDLREYKKAHDPKWKEDSILEAIEDANKHLEKAMEAPWSAKDYPLIAEWLKANEKPLALAVSASKRPRYYIPSLSPSKPPQMVNISLPSLGRFRSVALALTARSMLKAGSGDIEAARADLMAVHRLARLIGQGPTLIDRLSAVGIEAFACYADTKLATSGKLSAAQAKAHLADLRSLPPLPGVTETIDNAERFVSLDCVMMLSRKGMPGLKAAADEEAESPPDQRLPLDWDLILVTMNQRYDRMVATFRKPSFPERKQAFAEFERDLEKSKIRIADKIGSPEDWKQWERKLESLSGKSTAARREATETMADFLISILMPTLGRASEQYDRAIMERRMAEVALALAACKAEKGEYPEKLAALKPAYLKKIPNDLFIEKPLHYKRTGEGYLLYSVGPDMKDDGGKKKGDGPDCDDIVVRTK